MTLRPCHFQSLLATTFFPSFHLFIFLTDKNSISYSWNKDTWAFLLNIIGIEVNIHQKLFRKSFLYFTSTFCVYYLYTKCISKVLFYIRVLSMYIFQTYFDIWQIMKKISAKCVCLTALCLSCQCEFVMMMLLITDVLHVIV